MHRLMIPFWPPASAKRYKPKRTAPDTLDARLTRELVMLPVDGRYNETVMDKITGLVASFLLGVRSGRIVSPPSRRHEYWRMRGAGHAAGHRRDENTPD